MKYEKIEAKRREERGSRACRALRREGLVPGVIYGGRAAEGAPQLESWSIVCERKLIEQHIHAGTKFFDVTIDGQETNTVVKDLQFDPIDDRVLHVDFERISLDAAVKVIVPLVFKGAPKGEKLGGKVRRLLSYVHLKGLPRELPEFVEVRIDDLDAGESLRVSDLVVPEGTEVVTSKDQPVIECKIKKGGKGANAAAADEGAEGEAAAEDGGE